MLYIILGIWIFKYQHLRFSHSWKIMQWGTLMNPEENVAVYRDEFGSNML